MSNITVIYLENALLPANRIISEVAPTTLRELAPTGWILPFVAFLDGEPVLRADWDLVPEPGQCLAFVEVGAIPQGGGGGGGGGSDPMRTILTIAVIWATAGMGGALLGIQGAAAVGAMGVAAANAAVTMIGVAVVNALIPAPTASTSPQQASSMAAASPTYSLQAQGNTSRVDSAIPEQFGRLKAFPDFAAMPYVEFAGNSQYLYQLLCLGRGMFDIEGIYIDESPLSSFPDITYEVIQPGGSLTMFPANVTTSSEVSGQELTNAGYTGPFVANASGTEANFIGLDFIASRGLYYANDDGSFSAQSITVLAEYRAVDAVGTPTGGWSTLIYRTYTGATNTPQRYSERCQVSPGRYQVRCTRVDAKNTSTRAGHEIVWGSLRAYLPDTRQYGDVTLLAMRLKATDSLSQQSSRKVNVVCTRKLPVFNGTTWSAPTATRSPAWAFAYACKQVGFTDSQLDMSALLTLDATCTSRGDRFDGRFDNFLSFWEAVTKIAGSVRAKPFLQGGMMRVMRDQAVTIPVAMFSVRNIAKGSLSIDYLMPTADTADCIDVKYFDGVAWTPSSVRAKLPGSTSETPAKIELFGVTGRDHAYREGMYQAAVNLRRRKVIKFKTEMEGFIPSFGDLIVVQHDMPSWGRGGDVAAWNPATRVVTLAEPVEFTTGTHYLALRKRDGSVAGPYAVTAGAQPDQVVLGVDPSFTPYTGGDEERTHFAFGVGQAWSQRARVVSCRPEGVNQVTIEAVNEDDYVHTADSGGTPPVFVPNSLPGRSSAPTMRDLVVQPAPRNPTKMLASWGPAPWADHYNIEQSYDNSQWTRLGSTGAVNFSFDAPTTTTYIRVAAVGISQGPWAQVTVVVAPPNAVLDLQSEGAFDTTTAKVRWASTPGATSYRVEVWTGGVIRRTSSTVDNRYSYSNEDAGSDGGLARTLLFKVYSVGLAGTSAATELTLVNNQIAAPGNTIVTQGFGSLTVHSDTPTEVDYAGTVIWQGTATGFTLDNAHKIYDGPAPAWSIKSVPGETAWFAMAHYDVFGRDSLNISAYFSGQALSMGGVPTVTGVPTTTNVGAVVFSSTTGSLYEWNGTAYDRAKPQVVADQITTIDLKAMSAAIGELNLGRMTLDAFGHVRGGQTGFDTGAGFWLGYGTDNKYKFSIANASDDRFTFDQSGGKFKGALSVQSTTETAVSLNGEFDTLAGWYYTADGTSFHAVTTADGVSIGNTTPDGNFLQALTGTGFEQTDLYSAKFAVVEGDTYRAKIRVRMGSGTRDYTFSLSAVFSNATTLTDPCVQDAFAYAPGIEYTWSSSNPNPPEFADLVGSFVVPAGSKWASIHIYAYAS